MATSCTTVVPSSARATGPRASSSPIIAMVTAGDDAAAKAPSVSATATRSPSGRCTVSGNHGLADSITSDTATNGNAIAAVATRARAARPARSASSRSSLPAASASSASPASEKKRSATVSSPRTRPSHRGPAAKPTSM